jgi:penicillin-insensitive murein endopeptidase
MYWVTDYLIPPKPTKKPKKPKPEEPPERGPRQFTMADLPRQCMDVLASR